jgi:hypothetical protein
VAVDWSLALTRIAPGAQPTSRRLDFWAAPGAQDGATLAWSCDGRFIALGDIDDESLSKGSIQVVDAASRAAIASLDTGQVPAGGVVFAGDAGMVVAVVGRDLRAWTVAAVR